MKISFLKSGLLFVAITILSSCGGMVGVSRTATIGGLRVLWEEHGTGGVSGYYVDVIALDTASRKSAVIASYDMANTTDDLFKVVVEERTIHFLYKNSDLPITMKTEEFEGWRFQFVKIEVSQWLLITPTVPITPGGDEIYLKNDLGEIND